MPARVGLAGVIDIPVVIHRVEVFVELDEIVCERDSRSLLVQHFDLVICG